MRSSVLTCADIGANHDGSLERALHLIWLCADAGVDVVKFQCFRAETLVSREGFAALPKMAHQAAWKDDVVTVYQRAALPWAWVPRLKDACDAAGVEFLCTPYDLESVAYLDPYVTRWKIGSGDITYRALLAAVARTGKPVWLATGASDQCEVDDACEVMPHTDLTLMQCNTDYTGGGLDHTHLNVLARWREWYEVGLSDHTTSLAVALGAVALGATVIERHFTDDPMREGPDHGFAMTPSRWREMVDGIRQVERALGQDRKCVEPNEREARIVQRRCWRATRALPAGHVLRAGDVVALRPCPADALTPMTPVEGLTLLNSLRTGEAIRAHDVWRLAA